MPRRIAALTFWLALGVCFPLGGAELRMVRRWPDPYGSPRPANGAVHVPLRTSLYFELQLRDAEPGDRLLSDSVVVTLAPAGGPVKRLLDAGQRFADGVRGWVRAGRAPGNWSVYIDPRIALAPNMQYTVRVVARSQEGVALPGKGATWGFTTEASPAQQAVGAALDLSDEPARWEGGFFTGICNVVFCTRDETFGPLYRRMSAAHAQHPRAWRWQRDIWMTATDDRKPEWHAFMDARVPNFARQRETRRITSLENRAEGLLLRVEDFFGHEQYGVPGGRPLSQDYKPGFEVLVADGVEDARSRVLAVDDAARTVLVAAIAKPRSVWKLDYQGPPPDKEDPEAPGLFVGGGTHLRRFDPPGTPVYYWGRLDKEWDLAHRAGARRLVVNFVEAPTDFSITGRPYTRPIDYAQWHEMVRTVTGHLVDRYGRAAMDFAWSVFNEPDLVGDYWRFHWDEVQRFYDYTVDGVLRAFEDRGYDSRRVRVGGWELGAIFGTNLRLGEILAHCSPRAEAKGALEENAAYADRRLDGKRSRRVEELCRANEGQGSPCDFISVHCYNRSEIMAAKLIRAKEMALQADPEFYRDVAINSHESCPDWNPPPDEAAADSYLGNGYFSTWCLDVAHRLLQKATVDRRYGFGQSVVTIWPPPPRLIGIDTLAFMLRANGDGQADRTECVPAPIFHALTLLSDFGPDYWVLPGQQVGACAIGGFASRDKGGVLRVALFSHHAEDVQSRSEQEFEVALDVSHLPGGAPLRVTEFRFDRRHNSFFAEALAARDASAEPLAKIKTVADLRPTGAAKVARGPEGGLSLRVRLSSNGANFVIVEP